jgi:hypothetical protein
MSVVKVYLEQSSTHIKPFHISAGIGGIPVPADSGSSDVSICFTPVPADSGSSDV